LLFLCTYIFYFREGTRQAEMLAFPFAAAREPAKLAMRVLAGYYRKRTICTFCYIRRQGMTLGEIEKLQKDEKTKEEQIRIIRKERGRLLEEIHGKQQLLDRLDYMLHEMKSN